MQTQFLKYISLIKEKENKTLNCKEMTYLEEHNM